MTQCMTAMLCVKARQFQKHLMSQASMADSKCAPRACHMLSAKFLCEIINSQNSEMQERNLLPNCLLVNKFPHCR